MKFIDFTLSKKKYGHKYANKFFYIFHLTLLTTINGNKIFYHNNVTIKSMIKYATSRSYSIKTVYC